MANLMGQGSSMLQAHKPLKVLVLPSCHYCFLSPLSISLGPLKIQK